MAYAGKRDLLTEVRGAIETTLGLTQGQIDVDADLERFGVDSFAAMKLVSQLSAQFAISLSPAQFVGFRTVRELSAFIAEQVDPAVLVAPEAEPAREPDAARTSESAAPETQAPIRPARPVNPNPIAVQKLLRLVRQRYGIDLSGQVFASADEVVDALARHHAPQLRAQLGTPDGGAADRAATTATHTARVAIIGLACRFPDAADARQFWRNLMEGRCSIREIPPSRWDWRAHHAEQPTAGKTVSRWGALIDGVDRFDAAFFGIEAAQARLMDPQERLLFQTVYHALEDAGIDPLALAGSETGVFVGYEYDEYEQALRRVRTQHDDIPSYSSSSHAYYLANRLSFAFDLCGPSEAINVNCASSSVALNRAFQSLRAGECSTAIVAGVSLNLFAEDYVAESQYGLLSPDGSCRVFDDRANGFTRGEGVGVVVLRAVDDAERSGDRIYALIRACHQNNRGRAHSLSDIKHEAIARCLTGCYAKAGVDPEDVRYVELDGYATKWGDSFEFEGLRTALPRSAGGGKTCALGSLKPNIGHLEPASGIAGIIKLALSMQARCFPPTIGTEAVNEFIDLENPAHPLYLAREPITFDALRQDHDRPILAGVNSFADSGCNLHILLEEYRPSAAPQPRSGSDTRLCVLSARTPEQLRARVDAFVDLLADGEDAPDFDALICTLQVGREHMDERLAIAAADAAMLRARLIEARQAGLEPGAELEAHGIWRGRVASGSQGGIAALISGDMTASLLAQCRQSGRWQQLAMLWVNGVAIPWTHHQPREPHRLVSLPGYPFAAQRHWHDGVQGTAPAATPVQATVVAETVPAPAPAPAPTAPRLRFVVDGTASGHDIEPRSKMQLFLTQRIAELLAADPQDIPGNRNYLELGLNSMAITEVIRSINALLSVRLAPSVAFHHTDIDGLAAHLASAYAERVAEVSVIGALPAASRPATSLATARETATPPPLPQREALLARVVWDGDAQAEDAYEKSTF